MNKNQSAKNMGIVKKPNSTNNKKKKLSKKIQLQIAGVRVLKMAAFCLAMVSWYATGQGLISFVFGDTSMGLGDGFLGKNTQAFMISFGIQGSLLSLSMYMPQYWKEAKKKKGDRGKSKGRMLMAIYYAVCLVASFTFSFISFSESVYEKTQYINSDITLRQQFQTTLSETEKYILDSQEQLLMEIRNKSMSIVEDTKIDISYDTVLELYSNGQAEFYKEKDRTDAVNSFEDTMKRLPALDHRASLVTSYSQTVKNVNEQMEQLYSQLMSGVYDIEAAKEKLDSIEGEMLQDKTVDEEALLVNTDGQSIIKEEYDTIYNSEMGNMRIKIDEVRNALNKIEEDVGLIEKPKEIVQEAINCKNGDVTNLNKKITDLLEQAMNSELSVDDEQLYIIQQLQLMVEQYIKLGGSLGKTSDKLPEQKTIYALKNAYIDSPIPVPGQIINADEVVDENTNSETIDSTETTEESTAASKQGVGKKNNETVNEADVEVWRNGWSQRLKYLEEIIRGLPNVSITANNNVVTSVDTAEVTTVADTMEVTTASDATEITTVADTMEVTTTSDATEITTATETSAENMEGESTQKEDSWLTKLVDKFLSLFTKEEVSFGERMQEEANALIKSSRTHLSDINPIEKYFTILFSGPYRKMAVFSFVTAVFIDVISLLAGIAVSNINEKIEEERQKEKNANQLNQVN